MLHDQEHLPMVLRPADIQLILSVSRSYVYEIFRLKDFPALRVKGKSKMVYKTEFFRWLDSKQIIGGGGG